MWDKWESEKNEYEAKTETKEIVFPDCDHKKVKFVDGSLKCPCGAGWQGARLDDLYKELTGRENPNL